MGHFKRVLEDRNDINEAIRSLLERQNAAETCVHGNLVFIGDDGDRDEIYEAAKDEDELEDYDYERVKDIVDGVIENCGCMVCEEQGHEED